MRRNGSAEWTADVMRKKDIAIRHLQSEVAMFSRHAMKHTDNREFYEELASSLALAERVLSRTANTAWKEGEQI